MARAESRDEKIAEVRRALDSLQRLSEQGRQGANSGSSDTQKLWIDLESQENRNALVKSDASTDAGNGSRVRVLPIALTIGFVGAASAALAVSAGVVDTKRLLETTGLEAAVAAVAALTVEPPAPEAPITASNTPPPTSDATSQSAATTQPQDITPAPQQSLPANAANPPTAVADPPSQPAPPASLPETTALADPAPVASPAPAEREPASQMATASNLKPETQKLAALATPAPAAAVLSPAQAVAEAQKAFTSGDIVEARATLRAADVESSPDVAWALARSYDPRFLRTIPNANSTADPIQAAHWYRVWHAAALEQGLISSRMSVNKILKTMN